ncbi:uncharacterized protein BX663DRAFT_499354 [Cokeromyces recurvatus]|uniref:uncharacterized protein n=1 Tax=Cokeromyces recurvatus TaxID=90255 RepID=UPI00221FA70A|nr:uncharacterized protein BX663DRAFT_499354 [Cokeromyces recurvatus]KAI7906239.1 hypothetical protein BX663DRAFT_499354 [Cokeromyces recurvatus]
MMNYSIFILSQRMIVICFNTEYIYIISLFGNLYVYVYFIDIGIDKYRWSLSSLNKHR